MQPETRFARLGDSQIAYQVLGQADIDLVFSPGSFGNIDLVWEDPRAALFLRDLASFCRLIRFDRRGTGSSDALPLDTLPRWDAYAEEISAVMDATQSSRSTVMAMLDAGPSAMAFAASHPERVDTLILANTTARWTAADAFPIGIEPSVLETFRQSVTDVWGSDALAALQAPSRADDESFRRWYGMYSRAIASPGALQAFIRSLLEIDARSVLGDIRVPTLVLHRTDYRFVPVSHGRYLAEHIPNARFVELPESDGPVFWETPELILSEVETFLTGERARGHPGRSLATVLFTDIVGSTERAEALGDRAWKALLDVHDDLTRRHVTQCGGRFVKSTGDGILAIFEQPGDAIRTAHDISVDLGNIGLEIRAGLHIGELDLRGQDVGGIAVHVASRIMDLAQPGEIVVSSTVRDLVAGARFNFTEEGEHDLKGVAGHWTLFRVETE